MKPNRAIERRLLTNHAASCVGRLQQEFVVDKRPAARADLARLRREASLDLGSSLTAWERGIGRLPDSLLGKGSDVPTPGEFAMHHVLTLYALHQQSLDSFKAYQSTVLSDNHLHNLGHAVNQLAYVFRSQNKGEKLEPGQMPRRFAALITADDITEVMHYARQLVQQFRGEGIPLDYANLAGQIFEFQLPSGREKIRLEWAREFARNQDQTMAIK